MTGLDTTQIGSIELFCKAAELGSFSAAAEVLGLTPASVSRSIKRLEERLGVRLFARTTRSVRLTDEGELYWHECREALEQIAEAERTITGHQKVPAGLLRISVGNLYANYRLLPMLRRFTDAYPQVELELSLSNRVADIVEEGIDLAVRIGMPQDSRLVAHKLEDATVGIFATPDYLARRGVPQWPDDLSRHDCLQFIQPTTGRPMPWLLKMPDGEEIDHVFRSRFRVFDDALGCVSLGLGGGGLFQTYHFIAAAAVARGELVEVLREYGGRSRRFSVIHPRNRHMSARVRAFVEFMLGELRSPASPRR
ncbi:LysR family transcriptional regulator [Pseudoduganella umbonata]|uniref:DNA-binding transcriptional LysR family regulator n=1 Tax=Pseudoduganella umbonata TaxID=864828 RepID=A0A4P8HVP0_9BURK|nr:LysR family transcriptional regulator [Pseudoduganella umbonata]MBB3224090.1 DNA-binding transcriptional LysR family regulator [Pseudoduganella umbonata]QCP14043.1 LysR family transcriptional regulator [Pseudoduganella umbonata]